jgi:hypothetical protein
VSFAEGCEGDQQTLIAVSVNVSCEKKEYIGNDLLPLLPL